MCVIAFSPKGVDIPTAEQLRSMWNHNPDGAGYAFVGEKGKVVFRKGFMTFESLLNELRNPEKFKNTNFAIHFRIGTSGKNDGATCHPFPISTNFGELRKTNGVVDSVLFHNGIIGDGGLINPHSSDTQDFVAAMAPLLYKFNKSKSRDYFINEIIEGNRILLMYKNNAFKMFGDWKKDGDIWVSNLNYKSNYSWYGGGYGSYYYQDYDEEWWEDWYSNIKLEKKEEKEKSLEEEKADEMFANIIKKEYNFVSEEEMNILKKYSDDYSPHELIKDGYGFGYDMNQNVIWLEYTPIPISSEQQKLDLEGGEQG